MNPQSLNSTKLIFHYPPSLAPSSKSPKPNPSGSALLRGRLFAFGLGFAVCMLGSTWDFGTQSPELLAWKAATLAFLMSQHKPDDSEFALCRHPFGIGSEG